MSLKLLKPLSSKDDCWGDTDAAEDSCTIADRFCEWREGGALLEKSGPAKIEDVNRRSTEIWTGLRKLRSELEHTARVARSKAKSMDKDLSRLLKEATSLQGQSETALRRQSAEALEKAGAPAEAAKAVFWGKVCAYHAMLGAITFGATAEAINELYAAARMEEEGLEDWTCSEAAARAIPKDLLGMCPGGKPHFTNDQLTERKLRKCDCQVCIYKAKFDLLQGEIAKIRKELEALKNQVRYCNEWRREAKAVLRRLGKPPGAGGAEDEEDDEERFDHVFRGEDRVEVAEADDEEQALADTQWEKLSGTLCASDFPLRLVFLDKSGSMGCDEITHDALNLALRNAMHPETGSTLIFLLAAPGETQIFFRRPGDPDVELTIELGCSTWFNEPIIKTLTAVAAKMEMLDTEAYIRANGQPPVQVLCVTDGMDNVSPSMWRSFAGFIEGLVAIEGPVTKRKLYTPVVGPVDAESTGGLIPVWLCWLALGVGGSALLNASTPKEITFVDAVAAPRIRDAPVAICGVSTGATADSSIKDLGDKDKEGVSRSTRASRARERGTRERAVSVSGGDAPLTALPPTWSVGHRARVGAAAPGRAPKAAVVLRALEDEEHPHYEVILDDESEAVVDASQLVGGPPNPEPLLRVRDTKPTKPAQHGLMSRTADPDMQRLQVLSVVDAVTKDLSSVLKESKGTVRMEDVLAGINEGSEEVSAEAAEAMLERLKEGSSMTQITAAPSTIDPSLVLKDVLLCAGRNAATLPPEDRVVAQRLLSVALEMLILGGPVSPARLVDNLGPFAGVAEANATRRIRIELEQLDHWHETLAKPVSEILDLLLAKGLLESRQGMVTCSEEMRPCLSTLWRFFNPSLARCGGAEDSLRRAVNRFQRLQPAFSFTRSEGRKSTRGRRSFREEPSVKQEMITKVFHELDLDGNGSIERRELLEVLTSIPGGWTEEAIEGVIVAADADRDGRIELQRFLDWTFANGEDQRRLLTDTEILGLMGTSDPPASPAAAPVFPPATSRSPSAPVSPPGNASASGLAVQSRMAAERRGAASPKRRASPKRSASPRISSVELKF